ncbi:hypothetical protein E2C01_099798 [Portunus trituberculatus]|uniref:Uncharacterized protein n=1 Tax=Portunus trituberculatus TaxID=210409 RepID=A0A5B7KBC2_PORTR|nr:hypothetical protein [Portunus trituberculatus]
MTSQRTRKKLIGVP